MVGETLFPESYLLFGIGAELSGIPEIQEFRKTVLLTSSNRNFIGQNSKFLLILINFSNFKEFAGKLYASLINCRISFQQSHILISYELETSLTYMTKFL